MKKINVVAASAVALSAALASGSALAHGTLAVGTANYNAADIAALPAPTVVTVPWNGSGIAAPPGAVFGAYTVTNISNTATTSLEVNSRFVVTLPTGFTFSGSPSLTVAGAAPAFAVAPLLLGGIGSQTATFVINPPNAQTPPNPNPPPLPAGTILELNQVAVQGVTALATPGASLSISVQSTANNEINNNDATPVTAIGGTPAFTSDSGVSATFTGGGGSIDLSKAGNLGSLFLGSPDTTTLGIGTVLLTSSGSLGADGVTHGLASTDTATLTIQGAFNGIVSATAVQTSPAVSVTANQANNSITLANAGFNSAITLTASGTALLQQNGSPTPPKNVVITGTPGFTVNFAPGAGTTDFLAGQASNLTDSIAYTNGLVVPVSNFLTGDDAGYTSLLRVNNAGVASVDIFALVQPYTGGPQLVGNLDTTLAGGNGTVFLETQIEAAVPGLTLANSGQRATLSIIAVGAGASNVAASDLLVNPGGVVVNVN